MFNHSRHLNVIFLAASLVFVTRGLPSNPSPEKAGEIADIALLDVKPKLIKPVAPVYPYNQARAGVNGAVTVEFIIDLVGNVRNAYVIGSNNPAFERPALDAVMQWKFSPGQKQGHPVNVRAVQKIEFSIDGSDGAANFWRITKGKDHSSLPLQLQWDVAPEPISTTFPVYPFAALQAGMKGKTQVRFFVGPSGNVIKARVAQATTPELGLAALAMIETWQFTPPKRKDGKPVFAVLAIEHYFNPSGRGDVPVTDAARDILYLLQKHPEKIIVASELDQRPKPISRRSPVYPLALRESGETGQAVVEFFIDAQGDAQLPSIVSSSAPEFGYAAVQAVAAWRFEPAQKKGKTVITRARITLEFPASSAPPSPPSTP